MADDYGCSSDTCDTSDTSSDVDTSTDTSDTSSDIDTSSDCSDTDCSDTSSDCDLSDDGSDDLPESDTDTLDSTDDLDTESTDDTSDVSEDEDLTDDGSDELPEGDTDTTDTSNDADADSTNDSSDVSDSEDLSNDGSDELPDINNDDSIRVEETNTNNIDTTSEISQNENLGREASEHLSKYDSEILDENGGLRPMSGEEYLSLKPEQQELFEQKYNSLSQEERDDFDLQYAQKDLDSYNKNVEQGNYEKNKNIERDLNDIVDGQYQENSDTDSLVAEYVSKGIASILLSSKPGLDPITKTNISNQVGEFGRLYGPQEMKKITQTAYTQYGVHIPTPIVHEDNFGNKTYDYGNEPKMSESKEFNELKNDYFDDLKSRSEYPNTIDDSIKENDWKKIEPEQNGEMREEFGNSKNRLISDWEARNNQKWPTYGEDVYSPNGKLIRRAGDKYDAHHIQPLTYDGKNSAENITPLHASEHFDKQGVHSSNSPFGKMEKLN